MKKCHYCSRVSGDYLINFLGYCQFNIREHWCFICGYEKGLCDKHRVNTINYNTSSTSYSEAIELCPDCVRHRDEITQNVIDVKSSHVGGHKILELCKTLRTHIEHEDLDDAIWELKFNAALEQCNAVLNLKVIPHKYKDGNYIYKTWTAEGDLARIQKV